LWEESGWQPPAAFFFNWGGFLSAAALLTDQPGIGVHEIQHIVNVSGINFDRAAAAAEIEL